MKLSNVIVAVYAVALLPSGAHAQQEVTPVSSTTPQKFVCLVGALSPEERSRQQALREQLEAAVAEIRELPNGYQFIYRADPAILRLAGDWMPLEQRCCPYFDFALEWNADTKRAALSLSGGDGVKEFIAQTFEIRR